MTGALAPVLFEQLGDPTPLLYNTHMAKKLSALKLAALADDYNTMRQERLALQHKVDKMKEVENKFRTQLLDQLTPTLTSVGGETCVITRVEKNEPVADDWSLIQQHVVTTGEFDLLYRRINPKAVRERWDQGLKVPGIITFPAITLSIRRART